MAEDESRAVKFIAKRSIELSLNLTLSIKQEILNCCWHIHLHGTKGYKKPDKAIPGKVEAG